MVGSVTEQKSRIQNTALFLASFTPLFYFAFPFVCLFASLGPVMLQLANIADLGEAAVDLRQRALPACVGRRARSSVDHRGQTVAIGSSFTGPIFERNTTVAAKGK